MVNSVPGPTSSAINCGSPLWGDRSLLKTSMCRHFAQGRCRWEKSCKFAHYQSELRAKPNLRGTKMCPLLLAGSKCENPDCTFAHDEAEYRRFPLNDKKGAGGRGPNTLKAEMPTDGLPPKQGMFDGFVPRQAASRSRFAAAPADATAFSHGFPWPQNSDQGLEQFQAGGLDFSAESRQAWAPGMAGPYSLGEHFWSTSLTEAADFRLAADPWLPSSRDSATPGDHKVVRKPSQVPSPAMRPVELAPAVAGPAYITPSFAEPESKQGVTPWAPGSLLLHYSSNADEPLSF